VNKIENKNANFLRKLLIAIPLCVGVFAALPTQAGHWGEPTAANMMLYNLEQIADKIKGVTLSVVKNAALKTINEQVLRMVNGTSGSGTLVIEDWKKFIYTESAKKAEDVIKNDFFPKMFSGKGSSANYTASSEGVNTVNNLASSVNTIKNYPEYLKTVGNNTLMSLKADVTKYTLDQVCSSPSGSLSKGDYRCFSEIMKPQNNRYGIPILTEKKYTEEKTKNEKIAETQAGITGYKPKKNSKGLVVTPPQTIADIVSTIQTLPAKAIAMAQNPSELVTGIIQTYVNSLIQKTLSNVGLGSVGASFAQNLGSEISKETDTLIEDNVGALFGNNEDGGMGTDIVGPNNVGSEGSSSTSDSSSCGTNCR
jgi:hypothetical protein